MKLTRRELVAGMAVALRASQAPPSPSVLQARPVVCLHSQALIKLHYTELGAIVRQLGFEACDLTIRKGGHVLPEMAPVDVVRAIENLRGEGVDVPMITTDFRTSSDPWASSVLALAGSLMQVPCFVTGVYSYRGAPSVEARLVEVRRDLAGLTGLGRTYGIAACVPNVTGENVGGAVWDLREVLAPLDPRWAGYCFDPDHAAAAGGPEQAAVALRLAGPRVKAVAARDFYWEKRGGRWGMRACPMGEGMVDWKAVFGALAEAGFDGPVSLHIDHRPADEIAAITRDLAYLNGQIEAAWPAPPAQRT